MAQVGASVENNFSNGFISDATTLNFPENACSEIYDCVISQDGSVQRRLGFDFELNASTKIINRANKAVVSYLWRNVAGDGDVTVVAVQVGNTLYFYRTGSSSLSAGAISDTVTLTPVSGAPVPDTIEAQFCDGNGYLFVTHPSCNPLRISYNTTLDTVTETAITLKIRDFEGDTTDPYDVSERPTSDLATLNVAHKYNLLNQGWLTEHLTSWDGLNTYMPSNADVMWRYRNVDNDLSFNPGFQKRVVLGNSPAPKGHYILELADQDRSTISGVTGVTSTTTGSARPSTSAFFAGRVFYSGINYAGFNSKIYFTQIVERTEQYGFCHQVNDPTGEDLFDLLPSDGGVISIPDAGTIIKLTSLPGGLVVNANNGVWFITGSQGIGFTATDYSVQKLSSITTLTASSFVDVGGYPCWWNDEGIWTVMAEGNLPTVKSLTLGKIDNFFQTIPPSSKRFAKGYFNKVEAVVKWIYRSTSPADLTETYEFNQVLNFNTKTGAFHIWRPNSSDVKINAILVSEGLGGAVVAEQVVDSVGDTVVDANSNEVVVYTSSTSESYPTDKYLVSYDNGSSYTFTFAETRDTDYIDWYQYDGAGESFESYFISGTKMRGSALMKFQPCWTRVYSRVINPVRYQFQGLWDSSTTPSGSGRWSVKQYVEHNDTNYYYNNRKLKVRGHGLGLQFKVESIPNYPFDIVGWTSLNIARQIP